MTQIELNKCFFGDCRTSMKMMIDMGIRVQCCVTSPPYFGLRDYLCSGQIGLENSPDEYIEVMIEVFDLIKELLADDGTLWLNIGDSYANDGKWGGHTGGKHAKALHCSPIGRNKKYTGLKPKDLIGIPWMLAFALRKAGWFLRQDIIWNKPNPMPESVTDRCTKSHEYIFLLTKSERYYFDQEAILEPVSPNTHARLSQNVQNQIGTTRANGGAKTNGNFKACGRKFDPAANNKNNESFDQAMAIMPNERNKRSVWTINTQPYKGSHFATFPPKLIEPCILAGSRSGDIIFDPFMGSGTTAQVSQNLGRKWLGCELNHNNHKLQKARAAQFGLEL